MTNTPPIRRRRARAYGLSTIALLSACLVSGCAASDAIDIELVPDPNVGDEQTIFARIGTLVTIIDSESGLYPPGAELDDGAVRVTNADADDALEIVATIPVSGRLPLVRLERRDLADVPLDIRLLGEDGPGIVAEGRVRGARFEGGITTIQVPFNIRPEHLPPRVTEVYPPDGSPLQGCNLPLIIVLFSKPVVPATVFASGSILVNGDAPSSIRVPISGLSAEVVPPPTLGGDGETMRYTLVVSRAITDMEGRPLDQVPSEPDAQSYTTDFVMPCTPGTGTPEPPRCGEMVIDPPPVPLTPVCPGMPRFVCVDDFCVPATDGTGCVGAVCENASVCDPQTGRCALDCRAYGDLDVCPADRPACDAATGTCM